MECGAGCGACCIAPSISSLIPGMPDGKEAGERCVQLDAQQRCLLFGSLKRPAVCTSLRPTTADLCGTDPHDALRRIAWMERVTAP